MKPRGVTFATALAWGAFGSSFALLVEFERVVLGAHVGEALWGAVLAAVVVAFALSALVVPRASAGAVGAAAFVELAAAGVFWGLVGLETPLEPAARGCEAPACLFWGQAFALLLHGGLLPPALASWSLREGAGDPRRPAELSTGGAPGSTLAAALCVTLGAFAAAGAQYAAPLVASGASFAASAAVTWASARANANPNAGASPGHVDVGPAGRGDREAPRVEGSRAPAPAKLVDLVLLVLGPALAFSTARTPDEGFGFAFLLPVGLGWLAQAALASALRRARCGRLYGWLADGGVVAFALLLLVAASSGTVLWLAFHGELVLGRTSGTLPSSLPPFLGGALLGAWWDRAVAALRSASGWAQPTRAGTPARWLVALGWLLVAFVLGLVEISPTGTDSWLAYAAALALGLLGVAAHLAALALARGGRPVTGTS
ncbi:MAG: hypothetical protein Kow0069_05540 [Promethearchaeota archaeon]